MRIPTEEFVWRSVWVLLIAGLVVGIRCSGAVTGERERKTWEALLLTPMEVLPLIRGKFWGILGATTPYLVAFAVPALAFTFLGGGGAGFDGAFLVVTWLGMAYVGAAGIWCSVRSKSSWRSLLFTLVLAYVGGSILYCVASPFIALLSFALGRNAGHPCGPGAGRQRDDGPCGLQPIRRDLPGGGSPGPGVRLRPGRLAFLASAEYRVGVVERTKHGSVGTSHGRGVAGPVRHRYRYSTGVFPFFTMEGPALRDFKHPTDFSNRFGKRSLLKLLRSGRLRRTWSESTAGLACPLHQHSPSPRQTAWERWVRSMSRREANLLYLRDMLRI